MRGIKYDLDPLFDDVVFQISEQLEAICDLLLIKPSSKLFFLIKRKSCDCIRGNLVLRTTVLNNNQQQQEVEEQCFVNGNTLKFCDLNATEIILESFVKYIFIFESQAAFDRLKGEFWKFFSQNESIVVDTSGMGRIFVRLLICKLTKKYPNLKCISMFDGDKGGLDMVHMWKYGSIRQNYSYMNEYLCIPQMYHANIRAFALSVQNTNMSIAVKELFRLYVDALNNFPTNNRFLLDDTMLFLLRGKTCSSSFKNINWSSHIAFLKNVLDSFSNYEFNLTISDGVPFFCF